MTFECTAEDCACHHAPPAVVLVDKAMEIEPGKVYVLEVQRPISATEAKLIRDAFEDRTGATCVILANGTVIVGTDEQVTL